MEKTFTSIFVQFFSQPSRIPGLLSVIDSAKKSSVYSSSGTLQTDRQTDRRTDRQTEKGSQCWSVYDVTLSKSRDFWPVSRCISETIQDRHCYNAILIGTCTCPTQQYNFERSWVTAINLWKFFMARSIARFLCGLIICLEQSVFLLFFYFLDGQYFINMG